MNIRTSDILVCGKSIKECLADIEAFHGFTAPGLVLGTFMVDWARELVGSDVEADAIVETRHCLPDAIQIFTPCSFGNGWMKVLDWGKFALSLYDKKTLEGYRVWLDLEKARQFPNIYNWYMHLVPKKELPLEVLTGTMIEAKREVLSSCAIRVTQFYESPKKGKIEICSGCGEAYPAVQGSQCLTCQGKGYYEKCQVSGVGS
ncbi:FmdE family protein [Desulfonema magnum]|uniref:Molybdenum formylmethanofuran dehydrogenase domain-containing protein n=1 Tax=Desulfonema magnum TaxID=45655 RepID=A0A975BTE6_9BACT|nr:FmdE family protein [Desulfonema magnum]QTA90924.1 Molybdenum formylmethanofuran dehydrogenase domain-containing protein [Desulfonema magnum]